MSSTDTAEFVYSRWYRLLTFASMPLVALLALTVVGAAVYGTISMPGPYDRIRSIAVGVIGLWMLVSLCLRVKYAYVLTSRYVIGDEGVLVEAGGQTQTVLWANVQIAEYFPLFYLLRLELGNGDRPVALFLDRLVPVITPLARRLVRAAYKIAPESMQRSLDRVQAVFREVDLNLRDGRRFLTGERFTAADLTFAALAAPVLFPVECRAVLPVLDAVPVPMHEEVLRLRNTVAGQFALRLFSQERGCAFAATQPSVR